LIPLLSVNVYVRPSDEISGSALAMSGCKSAPPSAVVLPVYDKSVRSRQHRYHDQVTL
jgi:hypothetical protein